MCVSEFCVQTKPRVPFALLLHSYVFGATLWKTTMDVPATSVPAYGWAVVKTNLYLTFWFGLNLYQYC